MATLTKGERIAAKERNMIISESMKETAIKMGLCVGCEVIVKERPSTEKSYKETGRGSVTTLYPYVFSCEMHDGRTESFQYSEVLGNETRKIEIKK